jgi:hypothetical protein
MAGRGRRKKAEGHSFMKSENDEFPLGSGSRLSVAPQPPSHTTTIQCPECGSQRVWRNGLGDNPHSKIQRHICRDCAHRFSEGSERSKRSERLQNLRSLILKTNAALPSTRNRLGDASDTGKAAPTSTTKPMPKTRRDPYNQYEAVNDMESRTQEQAAGATTHPTQRLRNHQGQNRRIQLLAAKTRIRQTHNPRQNKTAETPSQNRS